MARDGTMRTTRELMRHGCHMHACDGELGPASYPREKLLQGSAPVRVALTLRCTRSQRGCGLGVHTTCRDEPTSRADRDRQLHRATLLATLLANTV